MADVLPTQGHRFGEFAVVSDLSNPSTDVEAFQVKPPESLLEKITSKPGITDENVGGETQNTLIANPNGKGAIFVIVDDASKSKKIGKSGFEDARIVLRRKKLDAGCHTYAGLLDHLSGYNFTTFINSFELDGYLCAVFLEKGRPVTEMLESWRQNPLTESEAKYVLLQIYKALETLHNQFGLVHTFVNSDSILLSKDQIQLSCLEFVEKLEDNEAHFTPKRPLVYKCPEPAIGFKYDVWCMGVVMVEICTGRRLKEALDSVVDFAAEWAPPEVPYPELKPIIDRCLQVDESRRPSLTQLDLENAREFTREDMHYKLGRSWDVFDKIGKTVSDGQNEYEFVEYINSGGYSHVFSVVQTQPASCGRHLRALKIKKAFIDRSNHDDLGFEREFRLLVDLDHPNVVKIYNNFYHRPSNNFHFVSELCDDDLFTYLNEEFVAQNKKMPIDQQIACAYQLLDGLQYVHSKNIIHRDITPKNILIVKSNWENVFKISDFGISKEISDSNSMTVSQCGTIFYCSPEIARQDDYSNKADGWALGCVIYELEMNEKAFSGTTHNELYDAIMNSDPQLPEGHPLRDLVKKMLTKDPVERVKSRDAFQDIVTIRGC